MGDEKQEIVIPKRWSGHYDLEQTILKMKQKSGGDDPDDRGIVQSVTVELIEELGTAEADLTKSKQAFEDLRIADQATLTETLAAALEQSLRAEKAEAERDAAIELAAWKPITPGSLPKVGDENGGSFGLFRPKWEVRPYERFPLSDAVCFEALKLAGWTHYRSINAPSIVADGEKP